MAFDDSYRLSVHAVITNAAGEILQLRATYGDKGWGLPGGAVDPGETVLETLRRECQEELGLAVEIGPLTGIYYHKRFNSHALLFRCQLADGAVPTLSSEHSEYAYFSLDKLSPVQRRRVDDCLAFDGQLRAAVF